MRRPAAARERSANLTQLNFWLTSSGKLFIVFAALLALTVASCSDDDDSSKKSPDEPPPVGPPGDGLVLTTTSVTISADQIPVVEFTLEDDDGNPVDLADLDSDPRFVFAWIDVDPESGLSRYQSYVVNDVAGQNYSLNGVDTPPTLASAPQAASDSGGVFETLGPGSFSYRFNTAVPADYDGDATHTMASYASREDRVFVANDIFTFVPSGGAPSVTREVVSTTACNECHNPLEFHGGTRRETVLCAVCHTDQTIDPETGETLELKVMAHKIHHGEQLTNLPYFIVGFRQSINDYSDVVYPQDDRYCTKCHKDAADADNWNSAPSRSACGSCHDDVNFETGENHGGGIQQFDDTLCGRCHRDVIVEEFDNTVPGAHTVPYSSSFNPNLTLAITDVQNMTPGTQPSVSFTITDDSGPVDITTLSSISMLFAGPTTDYFQDLDDNRSSVAGVGLVENAVGDYTYTPDAYVIPVDATETWSVGMEARTDNIPVGAPGDTEDIRFGANNPVVDIDLAAGNLGGGAPVARRDVVDEVACDQCHEDLVFHGNLRTDVKYCITCHNLWATDQNQRPGVDPVTNPPETIDFKYLIHAIHRGTDLVNDYTVYGFGGNPHDYTKVLFPGDLRDCSTCHLDGIALLPGSTDAETTVVNIDRVPVPQIDAIRTPRTAACTSCHDDDDSFTHARLNSIVNDPVDWGESCSVCHGEGKTSAVSEVHAR